jgi:hypothetical protein
MVTTDQDITRRKLAVRSYYEGNLQLGSAQPIFKGLCRAAGVALPKAPSKFIQYQAHKFEVNGTILDRYTGPKRTREMMLPDDVAQQAADLLRAGYEDSVELLDPAVPGGVAHVTMRQWWFSVQDALDRCDKLRELVEPYGVDAHQLLQCMRAVDDGIAYRARQYKMAHTLAQRYWRMHTAAEYKEKAVSDPDWLRRIVWIDECTIWLVGGTVISRKVWCGASGAWHVGTRLAPAACTRPTQMLCCYCSPFSSTVSGNASDSAVIIFLAGVWLLTVAVDTMCLHITAAL